MFEGTVYPAPQSHHGRDSIAKEVTLSYHSRAMGLLAPISEVQEVGPVCKPHSPLPRDPLLNRQVVIGIAQPKTVSLKYFEGYGGGECM